MSNGSLLKKDFFILLKSAITSINPAALVTASLELKKKNNSNDYLSISNSLSFSCGERADANAAGQHQKILLNKNIYVLAFGKAALGN